MKRIEDLRIKTPEAADSIMSHLAKTETSIELHKARANSKIATIKADLSEKLAPLEARRDSLSSTLKQFITDFRGLFKKPRKRKTESGEYGLQTVTTMEIDSEEVLIAHLKKTGKTDCFEVIYKVDKSALKKRIASGEKFPGVALVKGDTAVYKINPELIRDAKERAAG